MRIIRVVLASILSLAASGVAFAQTSSSVVDFEDLNKLMSAFQVAFDQGDEKLLRAISTESFERSAEFDHLRSAIGRLRTSTALSSQIAEQTFDVEPGGGALTVTFRLREGSWLVSDAKLSKGETKKGIPVLAREYFFSDFRRCVESRDPSCFGGAAPLGQVATIFTKGKTLVSRPETVVTVTDLALQDGSRIVDVFYIRVKKSDRVEGRSRGWLIDGSGSMLDYSRKSGENHVLLDFLSGKLKSSDLSKPSPFVFSNVEASNAPSFPITHVNYKVEKVGTSGFRWDDRSVQFSLLIDCSGARFAPPKLKAWLEDGRLYLDTQSDADFVEDAQDHRYLSVRADDGLLAVAVRQDVERRPLVSFVGASIRSQNVVSTDHGIRIVVELTAPRM